MQRARAGRGVRLLGDALRQCWGHRSVNELVIVTKVPTHNPPHTHHTHTSTPAPTPVFLLPHAAWSRYQTRSLL